MCSRECDHEVGTCVYTLRGQETDVDLALHSILEIGSLIEVELTDLALEAVQSLNSSVLELQAGDEIQLFMLA